MMIVLLVMTIILAAFAPLMTRRMKSNISSSGGGESLWAELTTNGPGIYYGTGNAESVIIGAAAKATDDNARLILKKGTAAQNHMIFKDESGTANAALYTDDTNMYFGSVPDDKRKKMNTSFGVGALANITAPLNPPANMLNSWNTALGYMAGNKVTTSYGNTFVGSLTGKNNTTGSTNTFVGTSTGEVNTEGDANTFIGSIVGMSNTLGYRNTFIGVWSGYSSIDGYNNTALGYEACYHIKRGSNKTCIGAYSGPPSDVPNDNSEVWIGSRSGGVYSPNGTPYSAGHYTMMGHMRPTESIYLDGVATYIKGSLSVAGTFTNPSDKRLKNIKGENTSGLEKIKQIKVFNYTRKDDKEKTPRVGVIAQDLQKIFPDAVSKGSDGFLNIRPEDILYALVNAVKELDKNIKEIQTRVAKLEKENKQLKAQNKALEARLSGLEAKINRVE
jgi:hypothetical protein